MTCSMQFYHLAVPVVRCPLVVLRSNVLDRLQSQVSSIASHLSLQQLDSLGNSFGAVGIGIHEWSTESDGANTKSKHLEHIASISDTTISINFNLLEDLGCLLVNLESDLEARRTAIEIASAVVGQDDGGCLVLDCHLGVFHCLDSLDDNRQSGEILQLLVVLPCEGGVVHICRAGRVALSAVTHTGSSTVDSKDDCASTRVFNCLERCLGGSVIGSIEVDLLPHDLGTDIALVSTFDKSKFSSVVGKGSSCTWANVESCPLIHADEQCSVGTLPSCYGKTIRQRPHCGSRCRHSRSCIYELPIRNRGVQLCSPEAAGYHLVYFPELRRCCMTIRPCLDLWSWKVTYPVSGSLR
ncbi:FMN-dependent alpha-hydroxy acid dehydrogenase, partial [Aureobasidium sp. EXF-3399]